MSIKKKAEYLLSCFDTKQKEQVLSFLVESQILEYGLLYLLTAIPYSKHTIEDLSNRPLGALIDELEKLKDPYLSDVVSEVKEFNALRKEIVHFLIHTDREPEELILEIQQKMKLAENVRNRIEQHFNFVYDHLLGIPYGDIF